MSEIAHLIYVVDDDERVRESMLELLSSFAFHAVAFPCATQYIEAKKADVPSCLILDVGLPDIDGLELQRMVTGQPHPPIVFITGNGCVPSAVQAMRAGAVDFLMKPFSQEALLAAIREALARDTEARAEQAEFTELQQRFVKLTPREAQVLTLVVAGLLNKQSAWELGISQVTLQAHRGKVMQKMKARSLADLVRMAERLHLPAWEALATTNSQGYQD